MAKHAYQSPDAFDAPWDQLADPAATATAMPHATRRSSGLRPAVLTPTSTPAARVFHPADEQDRTIQRSISVEDLDFDDAERTAELAPEWVNQLARAAQPSEPPRAVSHTAPTAPPPPFPNSLPAIPTSGLSYPSLLDLAAQLPPSSVSYEARQPLEHTLYLGDTRLGSQPTPPYSAPLAWTTTPTKRDNERLVTMLVVALAVVMTIGFALGIALFVLNRA